MSDVAFIDLAAQQSRIKSALDQRLQEVLAHGKYILGPEVKELELQLAEFWGVKHAVTCANGTDAILLALMALGARPGETVFCPSFTFAATAEVIPFTGATPFFVDVDEKSFNIDIDSLEQAVSDAKGRGLKPAGVIAVDLFGLPADYDTICDLARREGMWVIGDSAQGYGAKYKGKSSGKICDISTTSFFPAKPLGCYGDGGAVFTDDCQLAELITSLRFHGKGRHKYDNERLGMNSRLDTIQAAILLEKLAIYSEELSVRSHVANRYIKGIEGANVQTPIVPDHVESVWAQFTLLANDSDHRGRIMEYLKRQGIPSVIYYPLPLHMQTAYLEFPTAGNGLPNAESLSQRVFSLPMSPYLDEATQDKIIEAVRVASTIT